MTAGRPAAAAGSRHAEHLEEPGRGRGRIDELTPMLAERGPHAIGWEVEQRRGRHQVGAASGRRHLFLVQGPDAGVLGVGVDRVEGLEAQQRGLAVAHELGGPPARLPGGAGDACAASHIATTTRAWPPAEQACAPGPNTPGRPVAQAPTWYPRLSSWRAGVHSNVGCTSPSDGHSSLATRRARSGVSRMPGRARWLTSSGRSLTSLGRLLTTPLTGPAHRGIHPP